MAPLQKNLSWSFAAFRLLLLDRTALEVGWLGFFYYFKGIGFVQTERERKREREIMSGGGDEDVVVLFLMGGKGVFRFPT